MGKKKERRVEVDGGGVAGEAMVGLVVKAGGPEEAGRVWACPETIYGLDLRPGTAARVSLGSQEVRKVDRSVPSFSPSPFGAEEYRIYPAVNIYARWGLESGGVGTGEFCVGGEVWPNGGLQKGEVQLSSDLAAQLGNAEEGNVVYLHSLEGKVDVCSMLRLEFVKSVSVVGEDRREWLQSVLEQNGEMQMKVLRTLIRRQLNRRILLKDNLVPVIMLGCTILLKCSFDDESVSVGRVDGDSTEIRLDLSVERSGVDDDLRAAAGSDLDGNRKEAAISGAVQAAEAGKSSLDRLKRCSTPAVSDRVMQILRSSVVAALTRSELFESMGLERPKGVLFYGPPGSGKTVLAAWTAMTSEARFFVINGPSLISEYYGSTESALLGVFKAAAKLAPSIVFIDEIDSMMQSRESDHVSIGSTARLISTLLSQFDRIKDDRVVVLAATNRLDSIDRCLRCPGRFDREVEIGLPSPDLRLSVFIAQLDRINHELDQDDIGEISSSCHGFLPVDIAALCREASMIALRRYVQRKDPLFVKKSDFERARSLVRPSGLREFQIEVPNTRWTDIGGLDAVKQQLMESIEWPIKYSSSLKRIGTVSPRGVLLFGPPGCSKTLLAKAVANESGMNFVSINGSELLSKYVGESEKAIVSLFSKAAQVSPCIVFLDEIDGLLSHRGEGRGDGTAVGQRMVAQVLSEMDGVRDRGDVVVIGATNKPQLIDRALLRPGRFDRCIYVPPPDVLAREAVFEIQLREMAVAGDVNCRLLAEKTEGCSGAELVGICREAGLIALEEDLEAAAIEMRNFLKAIEANGRSRLSEEDLGIFESFKRGI